VRNYSGRCSIVSSLRQSRLIFQIRKEWILIIDKAQSWFWTKKWQDAEKEADEDMKAGRVKTFDNADNLMKDLEE